ncbi:MAG: IS1380 family transposase, partial [Candidatus Brocadia sp.]
MKNIPQNSERRQPKIKTGMNVKGLTVHAWLLPVLTFMEKLLFRQRIQ